MLQPKATPVRPFIGDCPRSPDGNNAARRAAGKTGCGYHARNEHDLKCIRVNDDDPAVGEHEILICLISWDNLDDASRQAMQPDLVTRHLDAYGNLEIDIGYGLDLRLFDHLGDLGFLFDRHIVEAVEVLCCVESCLGPAGP